MSTSVVSSVASSPLAQLAANLLTHQQLSQWLFAKEETTPLTLTPTQAQLVAAISGYFRGQAVSYEKVQVFQEYCEVLLANIQAQQDKDDCHDASYDTTPDANHDSNYPCQIQQVIGLDSETNLPTVCKPSVADLHVLRRLNEEFATYNSKINSKANSKAKVLQHWFWLEKAVELAVQGVFTTSPNPAVGCVIVKDNQAVAWGVHQFQGRGHAEVRALAQLVGRFGLEVVEAQKAEYQVYVTLEPCANKGPTALTGSCAQLLRGFGEVYVASLDNSERVHGHGVKELRASGTQVYSTADLYDEIRNFGSDTPSSPSPVHYYNHDRRWLEDQPFNYHFNYQLIRSAALANNTEPPAQLSATQKSLPLPLLDVMLSEGRSTITQDVNEQQPATLLASLLATQLATHPVVLLDEQVYRQRATWQCDFSALTLAEQLNVIAKDLVFLTADGVVKFKQPPLVIVFADEGLDIPAQPLAKSDSNVVTFAFTNLHDSSCTSLPAAAAYQQLLAFLTQYFANPLVNSTIDSTTNPTTAQQYVVRLVVAAVKQGQLLEQLARLLGQWVQQVLVVTDGLDFVALDTRKLWHRLIRIADADDCFPNISPSMLDRYATGDISAFRLSRKLMDYPSLGTHAVHLCINNFASY